MNYKALALGAIIGFAAALTPACGGNTCDSSNCNTGCCDGDTCITNTTATQCGTSGNSCNACGSDQVCTNGACVTGTPDAGPGICGPGCKGCCNSSGTCLPGSSLANCGTGGVSCDQCGAGESCDVKAGETAKSCFVKPKPDAGPQLGTCTTAADCTPHDPAAICKTVGDDGTPFLTGICTLDCTNPGCHDGSTCINAEVGTPAKKLEGLNNPTCSQNCVPGDWSSADDTNTCGEGNFCLPSSASEGNCVAVTKTVEHLGEECGGTDPFQCSFPPSHGACVTGFFQGNTSRGLCSADCTFNNECGANGICLGFNADSAGNPAVGLCLKTCNEPDTGRGGCPANMTCFGLTSTVDAGVPRGACFVDCNTNPCTAPQVCNTTTGLCH